MTAPRLAVVVSTIGRQAEFRRLMQSVEQSPRPGEIELVVVDQSLAWLRGNLAGLRDVPPRSLSHSSPAP